ncbi:DUF1758 domain-containing protein [Trichonephila clavipes]|nr:DUF1758 domain-containing protein [Trichonephila clavipes]
MDVPLYDAKSTAFMSTLDLKSGYHQVEVNPADQDKTAFVCTLGTFSVKTCCAKNCFCGKPHHRLIHFLKRDNQTVQRSVLNPLADVFGGLGGSNCVVPPQGENEENKSFVATSFLKNKTRTVLLSSVQCFLRDKYGLLHEVRALLDVGSQSHFITKDCADRLQLKNEKN